MLEKKTIEIMYNSVIGQKEVVATIEQFQKEGWQDMGGEPIEKISVQVVGYRAFLEKEVQDDR